MEKSTKLEDIMRMAAEAGAKAALETLDREKKKAQKSRYDRRIRNTKLLLRNYRMFKDHVENAVFDAEQLDENAIDILDLMWDPSNNSDAYVESIKNSVTRTAIIMRHITDMLSLYETYCYRTGKPEDQRRYRVVEALYIAEEPIPIHEIAQNEGIDSRTVYKDVDIAVEKLSALIFGIDGLKTG